MFKSFLFAQLLLLTSCSFNNDKKVNSNLTKREINQIGYVFNFFKQEIEQSHIQPSTYNPKAYSFPLGNMRFELYPRDTLIKFISRYKNEEGKADSSVEFLKRIKLSDKENTLIPDNLLGCHLLGVYDSQNEDLTGQIFFSFYLSDQNDLLKVFHLFKLGNVSAAFFYTKDSISPMIKYKNDIVKLLALERPLNMTDTMHVKF
jgi:hypothetical protein